MVGALGDIEGRGAGGWRGGAGDRWWWWKDVGCAVVGGRGCVRNVQVADFAVEGGIKLVLLKGSRAVSESSLCCSRGLPVVAFPFGHPEVANGPLGLPV